MKSIDTTIDILDYFKSKGYKTDYSKDIWLLSSETSVKYISGKAFQVSTYITAHSIFYERINKTTNVIDRKAFADFKEFVKYYDQVIY